MASDIHHTHSDPIARSVAFVAEFDPQFPDIIEPASVDEIAVLETLTGRTAPPMHRAFLAHMGRNADWLKLRQVDFSIGTLLTFLSESRWRPDPKFTLIGVDQGEAAYQAYLCDEGSAQPVVSIPDLEAVMPSERAQWVKHDAGSLPELICRQALRLFLINLAPYRITLMARQPAADCLEIAGRIAASAGLETLWFSTAQGVHCRGEGIALTASQPPGYAMAIVAGASSKSALDALQAAMSREMDLMVRPGGP